MKKRVVAVIAAAITMFSTDCISYAAVNDVENFLKKYEINEDTFRVEEYQSVETGSKLLFITTNLVFSDDSGYEKTLDFCDNQNIVFEEMSKEDWFDYNTIYVMRFGKDIASFNGLSEYSLISGTCTNYAMGVAVKHPWIIKTNHDIDDETKKFIGRVAQELLQNNMDDYVDLKIGAGGEDNLTIQSCCGIAEVTGSIQSEGNEYNFVVQFTYENEDEWNGTYDTLYIGLNNVKIYGSYQEIGEICIN